MTPGERWSILVELENVSEEAVIIDDTWLIACNAQKEEQARWNVPAIDGAFWKTGRTVQPGGRVVLFAGTDEVRTWVQHPQTHEKTEKTVSPPGLSAFAGKIRRAKSLRMRRIREPFPKRRNIRNRLKRQRRGLQTESCIWKRRTNLIPKGL